MTRAALESYGLEEIGSVAIDGDTFVLSIHETDILGQERTIYAFLIDDEIVRIGSSKAPLRSRFQAWRRDVSAALQGRRSGTPLSEAVEWRAALAGKQGAVFARQGTQVVTPVGTVSAYLSEEIALIERHRPRFCRR